MKESSHINRGEIDFLQVLITLFKAKVIILIITCLTTLLGFMYVSFTLPIPAYQASASFISPSERSVIQVNQDGVLNETSSSLLKKFLNNLQSSEKQSAILLSDDSISEVDDAISALNSIQISTPLMKDSNKFLDEIPYVISITGSNPEVLKLYLNRIINQTDKNTLYDLKEIKVLKINNQLNILNQEQQINLEAARENRKAALQVEIDSIKEADLMAIKIINKQIDIEKSNIKSLLNYEISLLKEEAQLAQKLEVIENNYEISFLKEEAQLAQKLGIIENNFEKFDNFSTQSSFSITFEDKKSLPIWFSYGTKALLQRIKLLEARSNNSVNFNKATKKIESLESKYNSEMRSPTLISLNKALLETENNLYLESLINQQGNDRFIPPSFDVERKKLEKKLKEIEIEIYDYSKHISMQIVNDDKVTMVKNSLSKNKIILFLLFFGFFLSIFVVLIKDAIIKRTSSIS